MDGQMVPFLYKTVFLCLGVSNLYNGFMCKWRTGQARSTDGRLTTEVTVDREKLELVPSFSYPGDCLSSGGGCKLATITSCRVAWGKFTELLSIITPFISHHLQRKIVPGVPCSMQAKPGPHWTAYDLHRLPHNDRAMIRWMYGVTTKHQVNSQDLWERMQLDDLTKVVRTRWLRWHSHVERSDGWLKKVQKFNPTGGRGRGRPKKT